jgi:hypothetical protein
VGIGLRLRVSTELLGCVLQLLQLILQLLRTFLLLLLEPLDGFADGLAVDRIVLDRPVVDDHALSLSVLAEAVHSTEALPQTIKARGLGDQSIKVEVCACLDALRADDDALRVVGGPSVPRGEGPALSHRDRADAYDL